MKVIAIAIALLGCAYVPARALDTYGNPDKVPSFGIDIWKGQAAGVDKEKSGTNGGTVGGLLDFRAPVTSALSLHVFGESETINNNLRYTEGYRIGVGLRVFIQ